MATTKHSYYKVYNGTDWDTIYFKTDAADVGVSSTRKFITSSAKVNNVAFTLDSTGDGASVTIGGANITGGATAVSGSSLQYISASDTVAAALGKLDKAAKDAYDAVPSGCLTTSNYATTLDSVYAAANHNHSGVYQPLDSDLTTIAGLTGTGFLKRTGNNSWSLDDSAYIKKVARGNGGNPSYLTPDANGVLNISAMTIDYEGSIMQTVGSSTFYTTPITIHDKIEALESKLDSKTHNYSLDNTDSTAGDSVFTNKNGEFVSTASTLDITVNNPSVGYDIKPGIVLSDGTKVKLHDLIVGDSIFVQQPNVPDRWYVGYTTDDSIGSHGARIYHFATLETTAPTWSSISNKPTTISGYGITDCSLNSSTGAITIGSVTKTPLYSHQDISGKAPNNHASSNTTYGVGTSSNYGHVKLGSANQYGATAADGVAAPNGHTHSQYLTSHQSLSGYATETWCNSTFAKVVVQTGSTAPTGTFKAGDIWIN